MEKAGVAPDEVGHGPSVQQQIQQNFVLVTLPMPHPNMSEWQVALNAC